jgi:poly(A) polymerase
MIKLKTLLSETSLHTKHGSTIRRYHNMVGKQIGNSLYVHKLYADEVIPNGILRKAEDILTRSNPDFNYNSIMFDPKRGIVRFDEAPDFDTAQEPHVGEYIVIFPNGSHQPRKGYSNSIWHHKWLWVKDDYTGFDVDKSKEWSRLWLSKLNEPAKGTDLTWRSQLRKYGLNEQLIMEDRAKPKDLEAFLKEMIKGSEWEGKIFLVGGFVRDELLGKEPKDADIVVGKFQGGVEFTTWLGKKLGIYKEKTNPVIYPTFGTANLRLDGVVWNGIGFSGESVDAVMFRKEQYHDPSSRKPTVQYTDDIGVDASRRDLTFNALYKDVSSGKIIDPTGTGISDLRNKIVRTSIDPTIIYTDDALRMFRAIRFAVQLGFDLAPEVIDGIKKNLHRLGNTSKERIRDELNKILISKDPSRGISLLRDTGLLPYVSKELQQAVGMTQNVHHKDDVFDHTLEVLKNTKPELVRRLIALFHDIGKVATRSETPTGVHFYGHEDAGVDIVERTLRNLKYPVDIIDAVKAGVANHMKLKHGGDDAVKLSDKSLRKFKIELGDHLETVLDVIHADNIAHADASSMPNQIEKVRQRLNALDVQVKKPNLPINGDDLIAIGIKPGPMIGKLLSAVTDAWFENPNISREAAMDIVKRMI